MRYWVVTLFPELVERFAADGLLGKAQQAERVGVRAIDPRDFTTDRHRSVDDTPYGGGSGMVMMPGPLVAAMEDADAREAEAGGARPCRVLLTPQGDRFTQAHARALAERPALTLICGRYEGVDERARRRVDQELSLGDFVLMGGELAALAVIEATARLLPGVLGNPASVREESHAAGSLEYPQYTRPAEFRGEGVPDVLRSGNHAAIATWRRREAFARTLARRPDLLRARALSDEERAWLGELGGWPDAAEENA
ncbi:MAG TPA: tRNA (guanosine(37)-N1)-methyltransferase TrmD [Sandaracinaceae bacterium LLY-WYZ-13_1]|nr:tRNA (guanosine(37)-N1)-methyltransferase TrmD [Sandaracinaceae bacterium LLY-WYZ-13_1]